jgi:POT family proton-dependent oligopeptide transporter
MGINLGAFLAPLACGYLGQRINWHLGFALAGAGMALGLAQYEAGWRQLGKAGLDPVRPASEEEGERQKRQLRRGLAAAAVAAAVVATLTATGVVSVTAQGLSDALGLVLLLAVAAFFAWAMFLGNWTTIERKRLIVVGVLFAASTLFFSLFEQAGSTLNLFAERSMAKSILGFSFPASWMQSVNALFIIALAPVFAWVWVKLGSREPSSPAKFALGLAGAGLGFVVLAVAASLAAGGTQVSPMWLVSVYLLHTVGELCLSPVGLSAMTKLAPERVGGLLMGVWFLSIAVGNYLGGRVASLYEALPLPSLFTAVGGFGIAAGLILALLVKPTQRLMAAADPPQK